MKDRFNKNEARTDSIKSSPQSKGVEIVRHALKQPMMQIAKNAGVDASVIVNKVMEANDPNLGYDALNGVFVNMIDAGIIDPTKVTHFVIVFDVPKSYCMPTVEC
jgi:chaperonin GroEL